MIFHPTYYRDEEICSECEMLSIITDDGIELEGVVYEPENPKATLLFFVGRSHDAVGLINRVAKLYSDSRIVTFNYRSYGRSGGVASEKTLLSDALLIGDRVEKYYGEFYLLGFSIGSALAAYLASKKSVKALFIIGGFDSIISLAKRRYRFVPDFLFRYRFDTQSFVQRVEAPTYMFASLSDETIDSKNTKLLKKKIKNLVYYKEFETLSHKELLWDREVTDKIKEVLYNGVRTVS